MLAYYFPPLGGGGVQRTVKHVKFLPGEAFDPVVVTTRGVGQPLKDSSLAADVPAEVVVLRPPELPLHVVKWGLESVLRRVRLPTRLAQAVGWPDEFVGWAPGALWCALRAVRRYRPDVVYSTSSPVSGHAVALVVKAVTGLPWVADFRDPWTLNPQGAHLYRRLSVRLERLVVRHADRVLVADESVGVLGVGPGDPRLQIIRNGVDADDLPPLADGGSGSRFRLAYVGMLYGAMNAGPILAALQSLLARGALEREKVELRIVGDVRLGEEVNLDALPISRGGYVDHREALVEMAAADVLLLYLPPGWRASSGKIYEYLATGRPILCVVPDNSIAARLVAELGAGVCVAPDDQAAIEQAIEDLYQAWSAGRLGPDARVREEALRRFSRRELTHQLAEVLEDACRR